MPEKATDGAPPRRPVTSKRRPGLQPSTSSNIRSDGRTAR